MLEHDVTVRVPLEHVPVLREVALADFSALAEAARDDEEAREHVDEAARIMDALGWDSPAAERDSLVIVREGFLRGLLSDVAANAGMNFGWGSVDDRRAAVARFSLAATLLEQMGEAGVTTE